MPIRRLRVKNTPFRPVVARAPSKYSAAVLCYNVLLHADPLDALNSEEEADTGSMEALVTILFIKYSDCWWMRSLVCTQRISRKKQVLEFLSACGSFSAGLIKLVELVLLCRARGSQTLQALYPPEQRATIRDGMGALLGRQLQFLPKDV